MKKEMLGRQLIEIRDLMNKVVPRSIWVHVNDMQPLIMMNHELRLNFELSL